MENVDNHPFPHGSVLKKFEGTVYHIGGMQFRPTEIQTEQLHTGGIVRRDATFDAENVKTGEPVILKLRSEYIRPWSLNKAPTRNLYFGILGPILLYTAKPPL